MEIVVSIISVLITMRFRLRFVFGVLTINWIIMIID